MRHVATAHINDYDSVATFAILSLQFIVQLQTLKGLVRGCESARPFKCTWAQVCKDLSWRQKSMQHYRDVNHRHS